MWTKLKEWLPVTWKAWVGWLLMAAAVAAINNYFGTDYPKPPMPAFGWVQDQEAVEEVSTTLRFKVFADTPAGKADIVLADKVYQWDVVREYVPDGAPVKNQGQVGSCVAFGTNNAVYRAMAYNRKIGNTDDGPYEIVEEITYAGSRVEVGQGRIRGDGSVGAWAADWIRAKNHKGGFLKRGVYLDGKYDLAKYSETRCRAWGSSGVPDDLEPLVIERYVGEITQIKSAEECKKALAQGYGVAVCSSQGFSMKRDSRGVAPAQGTWQHCMCIDGYHVEGGQLFFHIENSWGPDSHTGPVGWGNPSTAGFWAVGTIVDRMIKSGGDTWAFSSIQGFPARSPNWFVQVAPPVRKFRPAIQVARNSRNEPCVLSLLCP